jgi:hypothetical protein
VRQLIFIAALCGAPSTLHGQWQAVLVTGSIRSRGDAQSSTDPDQAQLRAERPGTIRVALQRNSGAWRLGIDAHHVGADLAEVGSGSIVATRAALAAWGGGIELARRLAGRDQSAALLAGIGATVDRWTFDLPDATPRWRVAARGALEAALPVSARWTAVVRGEVWAGPSVFAADEIPDGFTRRTAMRGGLLVGIARRL